MYPNRLKLRLLQLATLVPLVRSFVIANTRTSGHQPDLNVLTTLARSHVISCHNSRLAASRTSLDFGANETTTTATLPTTTTAATESRLLDRKFLERNQHWIVLVDDDEATRTAVGDYLYDQGFQITACADAEALLQVCRSPRTPGGLPRVPDIIVSDVRMPETDGLELLQQIRADDRLKRVPVVLLTAKAMTQDRIAGYLAGADAYVPKPFDPAELVAILDNRIVRKKQQREVSKLWQLKQELMDIKELMEQNKANVVQQTDVFLTVPEREVLGRLCDGLTNSEIAQERDVSSTLIARTVQKLFEKTGAETRTQLVRWAIKTGYVPPR